MANTQRKIGESSSGRMAVSKTAHGGSNPSSPANEGIYRKVCSFFIALGEIILAKEFLRKPLYKKENID